MTAVWIGFGLALVTPMIVFMFIVASSTRKAKQQSECDHDYQSFAPKKKGGGTCPGSWRKCPKCEGVQFYSTGLERWI